MTSWVSKRTLRYRELRDASKVRDVESIARYEAWSTVDTDREPSASNDSTETFWPILKAEIIRTTQPSVFSVGVYT